MKGAFDLTKSLVPVRSVPGSGRAVSPRPSVGSTTAATASSASRSRSSDIRGIYQTRSAGPL